MTQPSQVPIATSTLLSTKPNLGLDVDSGPEGSKLAGGVGGDAAEGDVDGAEGQEAEERDPPCGLDDVQ